MGCGSCWAGPSSSAGEWSGSNMESWMQSDGDQAGRQLPGTGTLTDPGRAPDAGLVEPGSSTMPAGASPVPTPRGDTGDFPDFPIVQRDLYTRGPEVARGG